SSDLPDIANGRCGVQQDHSLDILRVTRIGVDFPSGNLTGEVQISYEAQSAISFLGSCIECSHGKGERSQQPVLQVVVRAASELRRLIRSAEKRLPVVV